MLLSIFRSIFTVLIGNLSEEKKQNAWYLFIQLVGVISEKGAEGATRGSRDP